MRLAQFTYQAFDDNKVKIEIVTGDAHVMHWLIPPYRGFRRRYNIYLSPKQYYFGQNR